MSNRDIDASDPALAQAWKEMSDQKSENNWHTHSSHRHAAHRNNTTALICHHPSAQQMS